MNPVLISGIGIPLLLAAFYVYRTYNLLVNLRMNVERQASHVRVHLKKKYDMIPALSEIVKGYAKHEKGTFVNVSKLRSQWSNAKASNEQVRKSNMLEGAISKLLLIQERYPKLKADRNFRSIQKSIYLVERELVKERKVYNKRVSWFNVKLQEFPSNIVAKLFGFKERNFFSDKF